MKTGINPKVDCVFKAIFGAEENKDVLIHLLNAVLTPEPETKISSVDIENPYNDAEFEDGKQSIVDIKAKDEQGRSFQIEIQLLNTSGLELENLPEDLQTPVILKAMKTLERFSQSDKEHDLYMRRMEFLSVQATLEEDREEAFKQKEEAYKQKEEALALADKLRRENDELRKALAEAKKAQK